MRPKTPPPEQQLLPKKSNGQRSERGYGPSCLKPLLSRLWLDDTTGCFAKVHLAFPKKASSEPELKLYEEAKAAAMALVELGQKHPDPKKAAATTPASGAAFAATTNPSSAAPIAATTGSSGAASSSSRPWQWQTTDNWSAWQGRWTPERSRATAWNPEQCEWKKESSKPWQSHEFLER